MYKKLGFVLGILGLSSIVSYGVYSQMSNRSLKSVDRKDNSIYLEITAAYDSVYDNSDTAELEDRSELIVIGNVKSLDGVINYSKELDEYIMTSTIGKIDVKNIVKSDNRITENATIDFIRVGGTISVAEYEKSLTPRQIIRQGIDQLTQEEKETKYIKFSYEDDIEIEDGKDYLMYLKYEQKLNRYRIIGMEYGLKEYKESTSEVKNNQSHKWERLQYNI